MDEDDDWGDDWGLDDAEDIDIKDQKKNLNKLNNEELDKYKKEMDKEYKKHYVDPKDPGFVYDKRVDFTSKQNAKLDDSWDEEDDYEDDFDF